MIATDGSPTIANASPSTTRRPPHGGHPTPVNMGAAYTPPAERTDDANATAARDAAGSLGAAVAALAERVADLENGVTGDIATSEVSQRLEEVTQRVLDLETATDDLDIDGEVERAVETEVETAVENAIASETRYGVIDSAITAAVEDIETVSRDDVEDMITTALDRATVELRP